MRKLASNLLPPEWWIEVLITVLIMPGMMTLIMLIMMGDADVDNSHRDDDAGDEQSLSSLQVPPHGASLEEFLTHF